jgi:hypothetical protein
VRGIRILGSSSNQSSRKFAWLRSNPYERPWLRSASFGYYLTSPDFLIMPIGRAHTPRRTLADRTEAMDFMRELFL